MNSCIVCGHPAKNKYCSRTCGGKASKGGYREGSGHAKTGYFKGVYCGSTYELAWVIYQLDHNLPFTRFPGSVEFNGEKYFPDFLQDGKIIEIKGIEAEDRVQRKTLIANHNGYEVIVLRRPQLDVEFRWAKNNYQYTKIVELYDGHKPKYTIVCRNCNNEFTTDNPRRKCCSRKCSGQPVGGYSNIP